jgi:hypothetical protein
MMMILPLCVFLLIYLSKLFPTTEKLVVMFDRKLHGLS